jgi:hypothetical protein
MSSPSLSLTPRRRRPGGKVMVPRHESRLQLRKLIPSIVSKTNKSSALASGCSNAPRVHESPRASLAFVAVSSGPEKDPSEVSRLGLTVSTAGGGRLCARHS